jgi:hypothetical protein
MDTHDTQEGSSPGLWRLNAAASMVGLSPDAFAEACDRGDLPIEVIRIGPRGFRYVRVRELAAFLREPNLDLL